MEKRERKGCAQSKLLSSLSAKNQAWSKESHKPKKQTKVRAETKPSKKPLFRTSEMVTFGHPEHGTWMHKRG